MKKAVTLAILISLLLSLLYLSPVITHVIDLHRVQTDSHHSERFNGYKSDIEYLTNFLRSIYGTEPSKDLYVEFIGEEPSVSDKNGSVPLDERAKESLCAVRDFFTEGFCYIDFTAGETAFYGIGSEKLVYRDDRTPPSCFFDGESKRNFLTFDLGDGWYYLVLDVR